MSCYGNTAMVLCIFMIVTCILAFVLPFWLQSWEQKQSTFHRIGLWEVCFTAFTDPRMYAYRYFSGCWWIFHSELDDIREMLNPAWFKAVQAFSTFTLFTTFISFFFLLAGQCNRDYRRCGNGGAAVFTLLSTICSAVSVLVFGACARDPKLYRLPMPQYNYFGAGFAMMILCSLFAGFCFSFILGDMSVKHKEHVEKYRQ